MILCSEIYIVVIIGNRFVGFFFQAEDGIRDAQESRGLGDVYKRQFKLRSSHHWLSDVITHEFSHLVSIENGSKLPPFVLSLIHI